MNAAATNEAGRPARRTWTFDAVVCCLLAIAAGGLYAPVLKFDFVDWDDPIYVTDNPTVQSGLNAASLYYAWTTLDFGNWIPLTWMSLELDAELFGVNPGAFHGTNVAWHVVNACLVYLVLRRMTGAFGRSAVVALLFAVHPLHVESVAWIAERKDVVSTFFLLVCLLAYEWHARRPSAWRMAAVAVSMALGLLAKPMLVTLPVLLLIVDFWPLQRVAGRAAPAETASPYLRRRWRQLIVEKTPLFLLALADGLIAVAAQQSSRAVANLETFPVLGRVGNAINAYAWYVWKTVLPTDLCAIYPHPMSGLSWTTVAVSAGVLAMLSFAVWRRRGHPHVPFGWLWFVVALLPVIGLLQVGGQAHADRYTYVPHLGLFVLAVWEVHGWLGQRRGSLIAGIAAAVVAVVASAAVARVQLATWRNSDSLWAQALRVDPDHPIAHYQIACAYKDSGDFDAAMRHFERVLVKRPNDPRTLLNLGSIHHNRGNWEQAAEYYRWVVRIDPQDEKAKSNLLLLQQTHPEVFAEKQPSQRSPEAMRHNELGLARARAGRLEDALHHFKDAVDVDPHYADAHNNAASILMELRRPGEARRHFEQAVAAAPENVDFRFNLAQHLEFVNELALACEQYEAVLRLKPHDLEAKLYLEQLTKRMHQ